MDKVSLRSDYKNRRNALTDKEQLINDDLLLIQFQQFNFSAINTVMSYWPIAHQIEPNTHLFTRYLNHMLPNLSLVYPKIVDQNNMEGICTNSDTIFTTNSLGITEPIEGKIIDPIEIDLVLVPLLIFDKIGYRVGYGKGYYDRFLTQCRDNVSLIGFSYFEPVDKITDTHEFDIPLTIGITPNNIYEF